MARGREERDAPRTRQTRSECSFPCNCSAPLQTLEIVHPLGYRIQVDGDVNPVALRQVIEVLDERGAR